MILAVSLTRKEHGKAVGFTVCRGAAEPYRSWAVMHRTTVRKSHSTRSDRRERRAWLRRRPGSVGGWRAPERNSAEPVRAEQWSEGDRHLWVDRRPPQPEPGRLPSEGAGFRRKTARSLAASDAPAAETLNEEESLAVFKEVRWAARLLPSWTTQKWSESPTTHCPITTPRTGDLKNQNGAIAQWRILEVPTH